MAPCDVAANEWAWSLRYIALSSPPPPPPSTLSWSKRVSSWRWLSKIPRSSSPITCTGECHIYVRWLRGSTCSFASSSPAINCHSSYHRSSILGYQPPTHTHTHVIHCGRLLGVAAWHDASQYCKLVHTVFQYCTHSLPLNRREWGGREHVRRAIDLCRHLSNSRDGSFTR